MKIVSRLFSIAHLGFIKYCLSVLFMIGIGQVANAQNGTAPLITECIEIFKEAKNDFINIKGEETATKGWYESKKEIGDFFSTIKEHKGKSGHYFTAQKRDEGRKKEMFAKTERMLDDLVAALPSHYVLTKYEASQLDISVISLYEGHPDPLAAKYYVLAHPEDKSLVHNQHPYLIFEHLHEEKKSFRRTFHIVSSTTGPLDTAYVEREVALFQENLNKHTIVKQKVSLDIEDRSLTFKPDEQYLGWVKIPLLYDLEISIPDVWDYSNFKVKWKIRIDANPYNNVIQTLGPNPLMISDIEIRFSSIDHKHRASDNQAKLREEDCGLPHLINVYNEFHRAYFNEVIELRNEQKKKREALIEKDRIEAEGKERIIKEMPVNELITLAKDNFESIRTGSPEKVKGDIHYYDVTDILKIPVAKSVELLHHNAIDYSELKIEYDFILEQQTQNRFIKEINRGEGFRSSWTMVYDSSNSFVAQLLQTKHSLHISTYSVDQFNQEMLQILESGVENGFTDSHSLYNEESVSKIQIEDISTLSFEFDEPYEFLTNYLAPNQFFKEHPGRFLNQDDHAVTNEGLFYGKLEDNYESISTNNLVYIYNNQVVLNQIYSVKLEDGTKKLHVNFITGNNEILREQVANYEVSEEFDLETILTNAVKQDEEAFYKSKGEAFVGEEMTDTEFLAFYLESFEKKFSRQFDELVEGLNQSSGIKVIYHGKNGEKIYSKYEYGLSKSIRSSTNVGIMILQKQKESIPYFNIHCSEKTEEASLRNELFVSGGHAYNEFRNKINEIIDFGDVSMVFTTVNLGDATCGPDFQFRVGTDRTANENTLGYIIMTFD